MTRGERAGVWARTFLVLLTWLGLVAVVHVAWLRYRFADTVLSLALSFAVVQLVTVFALVIVLFWRKSVAARRAARTRAIREEIANALAFDVAGQDRLRSLRSFADRSRHDVEYEIRAMAATLRGSSRDRILRVARELGMAQEDEAERIEKMFANASKGSLLERAIAAEELEPDAARLAGLQIPRALRSPDTARVLLALDMIAAWRKALNVGEVELLLKHGNAEVRSRALRALPYAGASNFASAIRNALNDPDPQVQIAAAETARKLRLEPALDPLLQTLTRGNTDAALSAAFAIALLPRGPAHLQSIVESGGERAPIAFEALEKATMGRLELA